MSRIDPNQFEPIDDKTSFWKKFVSLYLVVLILFLVMFTFRATVSTLQVFVPDLATDFGKTEGDILLAFTIYNLSTGFFSIVLGVLTEKIGYKTMIVIGMCIFSFSVLFLAFSVNYVMFIIGQIFGGLGAALFGPANLSYASHYLPKEKKATAIGVIMSSFYISNIIIVPINAYAGDVLGWEWSIIIMAILCFIVFILILTLLPKLRKLEEEKVDEQDTANLFMREKEASYWGRIKLVLQNKYAVGTFFITLFQRGGLFAMTSLLTKWLQLEFGLSRSDAGLFFLGAGVAALTSNTLFSWIADKFGRRIIIILGTTLTMIWIGVFPIFSNTVPLAAMSIIILNFVGAISMGSYNSFVTDVEPNIKGTATTINNAFGQLSIAGASTLFGKLIFDNTQNYMFVGFAAAGIYFVCIILMIIFVRPKKIDEYHATRLQRAKN